MANAHSMSHSLHSHRIPRWLAFSGSLAVSLIPAGISRKKKDAPTGIPRYKTPDGKGLNRFGFEEAALDAPQAVEAGGFVSPAVVSVGSLPSGEIIPFVSRWVWWWSPAFFLVGRRVETRVFSSTQTEGRLYFLEGAHIWRIRAAISRAFFRAPWILIVLGHLKCTFHWNPPVSWSDI